MQNPLHSMSFSLIGNISDAVRFDSHVNNGHERNFVNKYLHFSTEDGQRSEGLAEKCADDNVKFVQDVNVIQKLERLNVS